MKQEEYHDGVVVLPVAPVGQNPFVEAAKASATPHNSAMDAIAIIDSVLAPGWFDFDRTKSYDALVAVRQLLQQHQ